MLVKLTGLDLKLFAYYRRLYIMRALNVIRKKCHGINRGVANFELLMILAMIALFSMAIVFGFQQFPSTDNQLPPGYSCCDSGNGSLCTPNADKKLILKLNSVNTEYRLLKTGVKFIEGIIHLEPLIASSVVTSLPAGQFVYINNVSGKITQQDLYVKEGGLCRIHGDRQDPMDIVFARSLPEGCEAIPNEEVVYVCTSGCIFGEQVGMNAEFDAYFRTSDIVTPGIPEAVKNCEGPTDAEITYGAQRIINLPSPSGKKEELQLETFYAESDNIIANWLSPYCKPAVYLYPQKESDIHVRVEPLGEMLITIPTYPKDGWRVKAYPNGDIFHEGLKFDYLFYEASIPDELIILPKEGYVVSYDSLSIFIPDLVSKLGLNEKETRQFTEYWVKVLPKSPYYQIKIVEQSVLGKISPLYIIPSPQTSIRVTLHFTPLEAEAELPEPNLVTPERKGFTVSEWGGIFKKDAAHPFSCFM